MTFPRKGSRTLNVGGVEYVWHTSERSNFGKVGTIQSAAGGPLIHYWPNEGFPSPAEAAEVVDFVVSSRLDASPGEVLWVERLDDGLKVSTTRPPPPWEER